MKPTLVLVGRPNVGKSTLFNRLTRSRDAIVADIPGLTRDRHYGHGRLGDKPYLVVDTGGFEPMATEGILHEMAKQTRQAVAEAGFQPRAGDPEGVGHHHAAACAGQLGVTDLDMFGRADEADATGDR